MDVLRPHIDRTDAKTRYSRIHLDELRSYKHRGSADDFESSHQEAFLFHLLGAADSFLQELNLYYTCCLRIDRVSRDSLSEKLKKSGQSCHELSEIIGLEDDPSSWLATAKEMRDHSTHRLRISRVFYEGGELSGQVRLKHPKIGLESTEDWFTQFESWQQSMEALLPKLRTSAMEHFASKGNVVAHE